MKAEDLLQAMNDIDTKYVAEAQPWTAPVRSCTTRYGPRLPP